MARKTAAELEAIRISKLPVEELIMEGRYDSNLPPNIALGQLVNVIRDILMRLDDAEYKISDLKDCKADKQYRGDY
jgi:hypothetical protein